MAEPSSPMPDGLQGLLLFSAHSSAMALTPEQVNALSPVALAYIGDAVYELFVRRSLLLPPKRIQAFHQQVVNQVRAEQQAHQVEQLLPLLTPAEQDLLRRGRNASSRGPRRVNSQVYQQSTAFEALIGYLYLTDPSRLATLLSTLDLSATSASSPAASDQPS
ncbi:Mini-ribonuclease 3 [Nodosilinea sp. PGN35]|uniref:Mini-ribonuclease 3 n=1 Tax=Nodosilinea sp. PGN35 TaxID=3020489 RepID=UPI0023B2E4F4|nr:ribonuclease III domain-containing protein [Nodosilinea sp. TSF1-S3]